MMNFFEEKTKNILIMGVIVSILLGAIKSTWGVGFFFGLVTMITNVVLIQRHVDGLLFAQKAHAFSNFLFYFFANALLGFPMLISGFYPNKSNIIAVALGELSIKYVFYVIEIFFRKGEKSSV